MPVIIAIAAIAAIAQAYQSEQARGANEKELKKIRAEWDKLVPPNYDATITDPPERIRQLPPPPNFDLSRLTPDQFKLIGKFSPELVPLIAEAAPELVKRSAEGKEGRSAQMDALRQLKQQAATRSNPELRAQIDEAARRAQAEAQSRQASVLQDAQRRGSLTSGGTLAAQLIGGEAAQLNQAQAGRQAAVEAYRQRMQALRDSASLGGDIDRADLDLSGRNASIINAYNERMARNRQDIEGVNTGAINAANLRNLDVEQDLANRNTMQNNAAARDDRSRKDALMQYLYDQRLRGINYQNEGAMQDAMWRRGERDYQNNLKSKAFGDQRDLIAGRTGVGQMQMGHNIQSAADRNQQIQGGANAVQSGYMYGQNQRQADAYGRQGYASDYYRRTGRMPNEQEMQQYDSYGRY